MKDIIPNTNPAPHTTPTPTPTDRERFEAQSLLLACGKLDAAGQAWMQAMLAAHPEWNERLAEDRALAAHLRDVMRAEADAPLLAFEELPTLAPPRATPVAPPSSPSPARPPWLDTLTRWWQRPATGGLALATIAALLVTTGLQTQRLDELQAGPGSATRGSPSEASGPVIQAVLADDRSLGDLRQALATLKLRIVRGPDEHGVAWLVVREGQLPAALEQLKASGLVLDARIVQGQHPGPEQGQGRGQP